MLTRVLQAAMILLAGTGSLAAQEAYPSRPITMVVAFAAGGSTDLIARVLAQRMGAALGQTIIIENKGGADGAIGTGAVARATPDGYTIILSTTSTHVINPLLYKSIAYNPTTDFQPIRWSRSHPTSWCRARSSTPNRWPMSLPAPSPRPAR
jgi:tripartite-type tricarboxylate transporter receptor subunit TctC